jgi:hypothetical protein
MNDKSIQSPVRMYIRCFSKLLEKSKHPFAVDAYQRGFVWNDDKIQQLAENLTDYQFYHRSNQNDK